MSKNLNNKLLHDLKRAEDCGVNIKIVEEYYKKSVTCLKKSFWHIPSSIKTG